MLWESQRHKPLLPTSLETVDGKWLYLRSMKVNKTNKCLKCRGVEGGPSPSHQYRNHIRRPSFPSNPIQTKITLHVISVGFLGWLHYAGSKIRQAVPPSDGVMRFWTLQSIMNPDDQARHDGGFHGSRRIRQSRTYHHTSNRWIPSRLLCACSHQRPPHLWQICLPFIRSGCLSVAAPCVSGRRHELNLRDRGVVGAAAKTSRMHSATHRVPSGAPNQSPPQEERCQSALGVADSSRHFP